MNDFLPVVVVVVVVLLFIIGVGKGFKAPESDGYKPRKKTGYSAGKGPARFPAKDKDELPY